MENNELHTYKNSHNTLLMRVEYTGYTRICYMFCKWRLLPAVDFSLTTMSCVDHGRIQEYFRGEGGGVKRKEETRKKFYARKRHSKHYYLISEIPYELLGWISKRQSDDLHHPGRTESLSTTCISLQANKPVETLPRRLLILHRFPSSDVPARRSLTRLQW